MNLNSKNINKTKKNKQNELYKLLDKTGFLNSMINKSEDEINEINKLIINLFMNVK